jgi:hypothetical protein
MWQEAVNTFHSWPLKYWHEVLSFYPPYVGDHPIKAIYYKNGGTWICYTVVLEGNWADRANKSGEYDCIRLSLEAAFNHMAKCELTYDLGEEITLDQMTEQARRAVLARIIPENIAPHKMIVVIDNINREDNILAVFDNEGRTADRYTVVLNETAWDIERKKFIEDPYFKEIAPGFNEVPLACINLSNNADMPNGVNIRGRCTLSSAALGRQISFDMLPSNVQRVVRERMNSEAVDPEITLSKPYDKKPEDDEGFWETDKEAIDWWQSVVDFKNGKYSDFSYDYYVYHLCVTGYLRMTPYHTAGQFVFAEDPGGQKIKEPVKSLPPPPDYGPAPTMRESQKTPIQLPPAPVYVPEPKIYIPPEPVIIKPPKIKIIKPPEVTIIRPMAPEPPPVEIPPEELPERERKLIKKKKKVPILV